MTATEGRFAIRTERVRHFVLGRSLADYGDSRDRDNIHWLRLIAALLVVLGHSYLAGPGVWSIDVVLPIFPDIHQHVLGLMMFFVISGYLITLSYIRKPEPLRFLRSRVLRLLPALIVCITAWAFVLGPMLSSLHLSGYFAYGRPDSPYLYVWNDARLLFGIQNALPGVFLNNPVAAGQVNTPLWSLPVEATLYLWVGGAGVLRLWRFPWLTSLAVAAVFSVLILWPMSQGRFVYMRSLPLTVQGFFAAGAIASLLRHHIRISTGLLLVFTVACLLARHTTHALPFEWLLVTYFVFWFAYVPRLPAMPYGMDLSYGTYIWAWPTQQAVVAVAHVKEPLILFAIVAPIVLSIAALSWFFVEKPALRMKDWQWRAKRSAADASPAQLVPSELGGIGSAP